MNDKNMPKTTKHTYKSVPNECNEQTMNKLHTIAMGKLGIRPEKTFGF